MRPTFHSPRVATIAGSDSGGEAGIQADLRTFALMGVHGATVVTCLTAQNRKIVVRIEPASIPMVRAQLEAVFAEGPPSAVKTGMLYSASIIREIVRFMRENPPIPLVVDPAIISTSGRRLLQVSAIKALRHELLPMATLATPNRAEAEALTGQKIETLEDLGAAARAIRAAFGCAVLVKGGHLPETNDAVDILFDGKNERAFSAPRVRDVHLHGTGCVYSAAIAAGLAKGQTLTTAIRVGKQFVTRHILGQRGI